MYGEVIYKAIEKFVMYDCFNFSLFWWTNETINIWSHIFGFFLFLAVTIRDILTFDISARTMDIIVMTFVMLCFQVSNKIIAI